MLLYIGVIGCVIGYAFLDAGKNVLILIQRKQKVEEDISKCLILSGLTVVAFGAFLVLSSLAFLPQILVASLGSLQSFYSLVWYKFFSGIPITIRQIVGAICICAGCTLMYQDCKSRMQTPPMNPAQLFHAYSKTAYQTYLIIVCLTHFFLSCYNSYRTQVKSPPIVDTILFSVQSAMLGTQFMVMSKTIAMLLRLNVARDVNFFSIFNGGFLVATIFVAIISLLFWINRVSTSESRFDATIIKPMNQITWIIFGALSGGIYFEEIQNAGFVHVVYALLYIVLGMWFAYLDPLTQGHVEATKAELALLTDSSDEESTLSTSESASVNADIVISP